MCQQCEHFCSVADPDNHGLDLHHFGKLDPDPLQSLNSEVVGLKIEPMDPDPHLSVNTKEADGSASK